jgi:DNA-binding HxlR family transcriptional regulator
MSDHSCLILELLCVFQLIFTHLRSMKIKPTCAIAYSLDLLGDKWSLLILRDSILHKKTRFKQFRESKEKIATNILTNRLKFLVKEGFLELLDPEGTKKNKQYLATQRGLSTLPVIIELYLFSIHSIDESELNESQINIKAGITADRIFFEKTKFEEYLEFLEELKSTVSLKK